MLATPFGVAGPFLTLGSARDSNERLLHAVGLACACGYTRTAADSGALGDYLMRMLFSAMLAMLAPLAQAQVLLQDNFDDNALDPALWMVDTAIPQGAASVVETGQHVELTNRGHLITVQEFDPATFDVLAVSGEWTFATGDDFMQVLTRSDGQPAGGFGETFNGIEFFVFPDADQVGISARVDGASTTLGSGSAPINTGETFTFVITDDGTNVSFQLTEVGGDGTTITLNGSSGTAYALDHVVFHNREFSGITHVAHLDNVAIAGTPLADLAVTKSASSAQTVAGDTPTYTIEVGNLGPGTALEPSLDDALPAGVVFVSLTAPAGWACVTPAVGAGGTVSCTASTMAAATSAVFSLVVEVQEGASGTIVTNTATVNTNSADGNTANDSAQASFELLTTHTVGGTVSGLAGSGLVLQNNDGDDLAVAADGSFTFATPLVDGSSYAVTVAAQPGGPAQTCTVANGSGTIAGANVTDVAVQCTTDPTVPGAPTGVTGTAGDGEVLVAFQPPASDGGSDILFYTVTAAPGAATCTATPPATACMVTGLQNGTTYTFTVTATNAVGTGPASAASAGVTPSPGAPPPAPQPLIVPAASVPGLLLLLGAFAVLGATRLRKQRARRREW